MSKSDDVLKFLVVCGLNGASKKELVKKTGQTEVQVIKNIELLNRSGNKIAIVGDRYYCLKTAANQMLSKVKKTSPNTDCTTPESEILSEVADRMINSGKVHKKLLDLGSTVGSGGNLTSQQQEYLEMIQKSIFYGLCAEALAISQRHVNNIQKEISGEETY